MNHTYKISTARLAHVLIAIIFQKFIFVILLPPTIIGLFLQYMNVAALLIISEVTLISLTGYAVALFISRGINSVVTIDSEKIILHQILNQQSIGASKSNEKLEIAIKNIRDVIVTPRSDMVSATAHFTDWRLVYIAYQMNDSTTHKTVINTAFIKKKDEVELIQKLAELMKMPEIAKDNVYKTPNWTLFQKKK